MKVRKQFIILPVLLLVLVAVWLWVLGIVPSNREKREDVVSRVATTQEVSPEELREKAEETAQSLSKWLEEQDELDKKLVYRGGGRDPLISTLGKKEDEGQVTEKGLTVQAPKLVLEGISWNEFNPLALINGLLVKEGDTIQGVRIVEIDFNRVVVGYDSDTFVLSLNKWDESKLLDVKLGQAGL